MPLVNSLLDAVSAPQAGRLLPPTLLRLPFFRRRDVVVLAGLRPGCGHPGSGDGAAANVRGRGRFSTEGADASWRGAVDESASVEHLVLAPAPHDLLRGEKRGRARGAHWALSSGSLEQSPVQRCFAHEGGLLTARLVACFGGVHGVRTTPPSTF